MEWTKEYLCMKGVSSRKQQQQQSSDDDDVMNILSWNVLAEAFLTPRSHPGVSNLVFDSNYRLTLLQKQLTQLLSSSSSTNSSFDILCLQEVDRKEFLEEQVLKPFHFQSIHATRTTSPTNNNNKKKKNGGGGMDGCTIAFDKSKYKLLNSKVIHFDNLTVSPNNNNYDDDNNEQDTCNKKTHARSCKSSSSSSSLVGMISSYQRRNTGLLVLLQHVKSGRKVCIANAHLYWNPGYEYVKLSQTKYLLHCAQIFTYNNQYPIIICGDFNSKPNSIVYQFLTTGSVDARMVAPWYHHYFHHESNHDEDENGLSFHHLKEEKEKEEQQPPQPLLVNNDGNKDDSKSCVKKTNNNNNNMDDDDDQDDSLLSSQIDTMELNTNDYDTTTTTINEIIISRRTTTTTTTPPPPATVKYLLDYTLNRLTRWLRILGIDAALETEEEEHQRTGKGKMIIFERCRKEGRTLITTSYKLLLRKDCPPGTYLIQPQKKKKKQQSSSSSSITPLEEALVHFLVLHGVVLNPSNFLSRCVVCNGTIMEVHDPDRQQCIFTTFGCPEMLPMIKTSLGVFECNSCHQGYWWSDDPNSSASRVKSVAQRLFQHCLRGGVNYELDDDDGHKKQEIIDFWGLNMEKEKQDGITERKAKQQQQQQQLSNTNTKTQHEIDQYLIPGGMEEVISWLKDSNLRHDLGLKSVYHNYTGNNDNDLPFTNVTADFIGTLDYILVQKKHFDLIGILTVPTTLKALNTSGENNGHLLPSPIWPSDHLAIGACIQFKKTTPSQIVNNNNNVETKRITRDPMTTPETTFDKETTTTTTTMDTSMKKKVETSLPHVPVVESTYVPPELSNQMMFMMRPKKRIPKTQKKEEEKESSKEDIVSTTTTTTTTTKKEPKEKKDDKNTHDGSLNCGCGCVPPILSLFEMAELRKQARLKQQQQQQQQQQ